MPSLFVDNFTRPLIASRSSSPGPTISRDHTEGQGSTRKHTLHALYLSLSQAHPTIANVEDTISTLAQLDESKRLSLANDEEEALKNAVISKLLVGLYAEALDTYLSQATQVEAEAEWWADIERSRLSVALYLLQTTPIRLANLAQTIIEKLHAHDLPLRLSTLTPRSLRLLFPSPDTFRPSALTTVLFPHLTQQPLSVTLASSPSFFFPPLSPPPNGDASRISALATTLFYYTNLALSFVTLPLALTRQECRHKRRALEKIRDERAESLGKIALLRGTIGEAIKQPTNPALIDFIGGLADTVSIPELNKKLTPLHSKLANSPLLSTLLLLSERTTSLAPAHAQVLNARRLLRPPRLVLLWPSLLLLPPLITYTFRSLYTSRATLVDMGHEAAETISGFVKGWLIEPLRDVLKTVRAGGEEGVIVRKEGVLADLESLERMTLSLARDELHYDSAQLDALAQQIRLGDLTPILRIYEEDIRRPLRSALTGTLLRSVFIQVQKAKVDIDQALTGIDKLLKSQELTFAFVGVAPALALVYFFTTGLGRLYGITGVGKGRYGGKSQRRGVWLVMRRIERLLIIQPESPDGSHTNSPASPPQSSTLSHPTPSTSSLPALPTGLILLSLARLRSYATAYLPPNSALRTGFLEDVADLADPAVGAQGKVRIVERMWRCWGGDRVLGWGNGGM